MSLATGNEQEIVPAGSRYGRRLWRGLKATSQAVLPFAVLLAAAWLIGMVGVNYTGPTYPDSPRYANGGAMIHDWLLSGEWLQPLEFAKTNFYQYPGFSIPYHPPAYPALLGLAFLPAGVSYFMARAFVAACLGSSACLVFALGTRLGLGRTPAMANSLMFLTMFEIAHWGRDTMSEIPALTFILGASYLFLVWLDTQRPWSCWAALALAQVAFLSRVLTVGVLPAWVLFAVLTGRRRLLLSPHLLLALLLYVGVSTGWVQFAKQFCRYELSESGGVTQFSTARVEFFTQEHLLYYPAALPAMVGWWTLAAALAGAAATAWGAWRGTVPRTGLFGLTWLASYSVFQLALALNEQRYFVFALPGLWGLAASLFDPGGPRWLRGWFAPGLCALAVALNGMRLAELPRGVVGYSAVARQLAAADKPGNVLMACCEDQELIFRYRASKSGIQRALLRSDRTLALRVSPTVSVAPQIFVRFPEDVLEILRRGRVRFLVTCMPERSNHDYRAEEMVLAHKTAVGRPESFALAGRLPLLIDFGGKGQRWEVFIWEFLEELPPGPSELLISVPTAGLTLEQSTR